MSEYKPPAESSASASPPAASSAPGGGVAAVFAEINRGEDVTKGLRKVDRSEMTHKNPALRASSVVPAPVTCELFCVFYLRLLFHAYAAAPKKPTKPSKPPALAGKKPSKFGLEGTKWIVVGILENCSNNFSRGLFGYFQDFYENDDSIVVKDAELNHTVNVYGCKNVTIQVSGKINAVTIGLINFSKL